MLVKYGPGCTAASSLQNVCVCSASKVRTLLGSGDLFAGPHNFKGQFEGLHLVFRLGLDLGLEQGEGLGNTLHL